MQLNDFNKAFKLSSISFSWQHLKPLSCLVFLSFSSRGQVDTSLLLTVGDQLVGSNKTARSPKALPGVFCGVPSFQNAYCNRQPSKPTHDPLSQPSTALQPHVELLMQPQERQYQQTPSACGALHRWQASLRGMKIFNAIERYRGTVVKNGYKDLWRGNYSQRPALNCTALEDLLSCKAQHSAPYVAASPEETVSTASDYICKHFCSTKASTDRRADSATSLV